MFKKTLIAAAVSMIATAPAFADVKILNATDFAYDEKAKEYRYNSWVIDEIKLPNSQVTDIAYVSKASAIAFSTATLDINVKFDNSSAADRELRDNGFLVIELNEESGATFNPAKVHEWLTVETSSGSLPGLAVSDQGAATSSALTELKRFFKTKEDATYTTITHVIDTNNRRLLIDLTADIETTVAENARVDLNLSVANNIFRLNEVYDTPVKPTIQNNNVRLTIGAQQNGSFTHDPIKSPIVFDQYVDLYKVDNVNVGEATALVNTYYENYVLGLGNNAIHNGYDFKFPRGSLGEDENIVGSFKISNLTTNQNIQKGQLRMAIAGDFSGFKKDNENHLLAKGNVDTGWKVVDNVAYKLVDKTGTMQNTTSTGTANINAALYAFDAAFENGDSPINGGIYTVSTEIGQFSRDGVEKATANETESYYPFSTKSVQLFNVQRDGMKFDTITTGSSATNKIFIRDISDRLGTEGGQILVTLIEYDKHGAHQNGKGTEHVKRKPLSVRLPSNGAVTLTPKSITDDLGLTIQPGHQARFIFEVQTNQGEVAVKKSNSEGVDVQNGTRNVNQRNGDNGNEVDFTL